MTDKSKVRKFFPKVRDYNPRGKHRFDGGMEIEEFKEYLEKLLGDSPNALKLLDYARRLIGAADLVEEWRKAKEAVLDFFDGLRESLSPTRDHGLPSAIVDYWNEKNPEMQFGIAMDSGDYHGAIDEYYGEQLRVIFGDPQGKYLLEWGDFCHTSRTAPILYADIMRRVAVLLLNRAEDLLN